MYYTFDDDATTAELCDTVDSRLAYGYIPQTELQAAVKHFSLPCQTLVLLTSPSHLNEVFVYDDCIFTVIDTRCDRFAVYVRKNLLLVVAIKDSSHTVRDSFISLAPIEEPTLARLICILIEDLISCDSKYLLTARETVEKMEKQELKSFLPIGDKITRLKESVRMIRENIEHLRDAYQSNLDLRLNQTMKIFTVFTVLFSPLSFIVGWYGMNFKYMPELSSPYGYAGVAALVLAVAVGLLIWFKHKRWI